MVLIKIIFTLFVLTKIVHSTKINKNDLVLTDIINSGLENIIKIIDKAEFVRNIDLLPGISLTKATKNISSRTARRINLDDELPTNAEERNNKLWSLVNDAAKRFVTERNLSIKLSNNTLENVGRALEEGRARMKGMNNNSLFFGVGMTVLTLPVLLGGLSLLSFKALLVAKAALILSSILFIIGILSGHTTNVIPSYWPDYPTSTNYLPYYPSGVNHLGGWNSLRRTNARSLIEEQQEKKYNNN